jgi:hypothetical protein
MGPGASACAAQCCGMHSTALRALRLRGDRRALNKLIRIAARGNPDKENFMSNNSHLNTSGDGSRPVTIAGVDNIGAADAFTPSKTPGGTDAAPQPTEKMAEKRQDDTSDSATHPAPRTRD